jgi:hypothetical protein
MVKSVVPKIIASLSLFAVGTVLVSCSGNSSSIPAQPTPNIAGAWEFVAISNSGSVTGIEVALTEGKVLVDGIQQPDGQISATSTQISFVSLNPTTLAITDFGGPCQPITGVNGLAGSATTADGPIQFSFTENGNVFNVTATLSGDGKSVLDGTYTSDIPNSCAADNGGTITGLAVSKVSGTFHGQMCPLTTTCASSQDFTNSVIAAASENSSSVLTLNLTLTGTDNTTLTLSGPVAGRAFVLQGTVQGQVVMYNGYYETVNNVPSIYLADTTNPATPSYVGTLALQTP